MGLDGYYRRFIKGFSKIGNPLIHYKIRGRNLYGKQSVKPTFNRESIF